MDGPCVAKICRPHAVDYVYFGSSVALFMIKLLMLMRLYSRGGGASTLVGEGKGSTLVGWGRGSTLVGEGLYSRGGGGLLLWQTKTIDRLLILFPKNFYVSSVICMFELVENMHWAVINCDSSSLAIKFD